MTKQQEIREVIDLHTDDRCLYPDKVCSWRSKEGYCASDNDSHACLMKRLGELGIVIAVEGELPNYPGDKIFRGLLKSDIYLNSQDDMLKKGYKLTIPLLEKK